MAMFAIVCLKISKRTHEEVLDVLPEMFSDVQIQPFLFFRCCESKISNSTISSVVFQFTISNSPVFIQLGVSKNIGIPQIIHFS